MILSLLCISSCGNNNEEVDKGNLDSSDYGNVTSASKEDEELDYNENNSESDSENNESESQTMAREIANSGANTDADYGGVVKPK